MTYTDKSLEREINRGTGMGGPGGVFGGRGVFIWCIGVQAGSDGGMPGVRGCGLPSMWRWVGDGAGCGEDDEGDVMSEKPYLMPITLRKANDFVAAHHRHNGRTSRNGGKWACGLAVGDCELVGVAIVGNPLSATLMDGWTAEVLRVCVIDDSPKGSCSMLYGACWRAWRAMGGRRLITYTLHETESGASLRGAGWRIVGQTKPVKDGWRKNDHLNETRTYSAVMGKVKDRWQMDLFTTNGQEITDA